MLTTAARTGARTAVTSATLLAFIVGIACAEEFRYTEPDNDRHPLNHEVHDESRPQPPQVNPGPAGPPVPAPSDAIVLFDGSGFDHWQHGDGSDVEWELTDEDTMRVVPGTGDIQTRETFGDVQIHVEYRADPDSPGSGQSRSNSGIFFGSYEVQVLDSYDNPTYPDGMNASIYGQYPPLVNPSRPAGQWQTYDIVYRAPRFGDEGQVEEPAYITVFLNNVLVQDNEEVIGPTSHGSRTPYSAHGDVPIRLQDHRDDPIHFRNIWIREIEPRGAEPE